MNYNHSLRNNQEFRLSLATLHNFCHIAQTTCVVQFYLTTIQYAASSTVVKHFVMQFPSGVCYFVTFSSGHCIQHRYH